MATFSSITGGPLHISFHNPYPTGNGFFRTKIVLMFVISSTIFRPWIIPEN